MVIVFVSFGEKRTYKGVKETAEWLAFKRHLKEYRQTKRDPIDSVIIWEKYLVYGTVLGISSKALSQLPVNFKQAEERALLAYWGVDGTSIGSISSSISSVSSAILGISSSVSSAYGASGVGSSGGASGGGGGGAG